MFRGKYILQDLKEKYKPMSNERAIIVKKNMLDMNSFYETSKKNKYMNEKEIISSIYSFSLKRCIKKIKKLNLNILGFCEGFFNGDKKGGHLNFVCNYKEWVFICIWHKEESYSQDEDIWYTNEINYWQESKENYKKNGLFILYNPENLYTNEKIDTSIDLFGSMEKLKFVHLIELFNTSSDIYRNKYFDQRINILEKLQERGFEVVNMALEYSVHYSRAIFKIKIPIEFQCKSDTIVIMDKNSIINNYNYLFDHEYFFHLTREWDGSYDYFFSIYPNNYNYHFDFDIKCKIQDFTTQGYIDSIVKLDKIVFGCWGYLHDGNYFNNNNISSHIKKLLKPWKKLKKHDLSYSLNFTPYDTFYPINLSVTFDYFHTINWFSDLGSSYITRYSHKIVLNILHIQNTNHISVTTVHTISEHIILKQLKNFDIDKSSVNILLNNTAVHNFNWPILLQYIHSISSDFHDEYIL